MSRHNWRVSGHGIYPKRIFWAKKIKKFIKIYKGSAKNFLKKAIFLQFEAKIVALREFPRISDGEKISVWLG
ncbi:MAG: hypothetical protein ABIL20_03800 [candidate division WOR-3 bacterium]